MKTLVSTILAGALVALVCVSPVRAESPAANVVANAMVLSNLCQSGVSLNLEMVKMLIDADQLELNEASERSVEIMKEWMRQLPETKTRKIIACMVIDRDFGPKGVAVRDLLIFARGTVEASIQ